MDENARMMSDLLNKKSGNYNSDLQNFVAPTEITVTITLDEYRALVSNNATRKMAIDTAEKDKFARETEIKSLTEANNKLKGENYDLKMQIDSLKEQIAKLAEGTDEDA